MQQLIHKISHLGKPGRFKVLFRSAHWNLDWQPGPFPKTEEEMVAAAKKYKLLREEYEPIPEKGDNAGDYPNLPYHLVDDNDPHYPWDFPEDKRNFGDPIHREFVNLGSHRLNLDTKDMFSGWLQLCTFLGAIFGSCLLWELLDNFKHFQPIKPKQYPKEGVIHYTFKK